MRRVVYLSLPGSEVKNKHPLEFELPEETVRLIFLYVQRYLPVLSDRRDGLLFPGKVKALTYADRRDGPI